MKKYFVNSFYLSIVVLAFSSLALAESTDYTFDDGGMEIVQKTEFIGKDTLKISIYDTKYLKKGEISNLDPVENLTIFKDDPFTTIEGEKIEAGVFLFKGITSGKWMIQSSELTKPLPRPVNTFNDAEYH